MTLHDLMEFLWDEAERGTLSRQKIDRCVLLAYEMGYDLGRENPRQIVVLDLDPDVQQKETP